MPDDMDEIIADFITEAEESIERIDPLFIELEAKGYDKEMLDEIFRSMHTIKGAAGFLGFKPIVDVSHKAESILKKLRDEGGMVTKPLMDVILMSIDMLKLLLMHLKAKDGVIEDTSALLKDLDDALNLMRMGQAGERTEAFSSQMLDNKAVNGEEEKSYTLEGNTEGIAGKEPEHTSGKNAGQSAAESLQTLRIDVNRVDKVMDLTGEIVLVRNRLMNIAGRLEEQYYGEQHIESLVNAVSFLDLITSDMQLAVMKMRMQPLKKVFGKFPRLVRDMSNRLGKNVELTITGEETEVDRAVIEMIGDPMVHIIRNSIDHGLEPQEERERKGKPGTGRVTISAYQQGNQILIDVSDDGKGIDVERVKRKAVEKSLITEEEGQRMSDESAINLIFSPGFSTADVATELSGRGVGMDVVKTNIAKLNGYVSVITRKGNGTTFRISIPLTLAIIQALMIRTGGSLYAVPLAPVEETVKVHSEDIKDVSGQKVLVIRERVLPVFELSDILGLTGNGYYDYRCVIVISIGERRFCIAVDELIGQEEAVIKTIEGVDTESSYIVGATITGEGKVVLILDLSGISRNALGMIKMQQGQE